MPKTFFEIHGLLTLAPETKREREVWHPVVCVTSEETRDRIFRRLFSDDNYAKQNGTAMYEDFKKVNVESVPAPVDRNKRSKVGYVRAPEPDPMPGQTGVAAPSEDDRPERRRRRRKRATPQEPSRQAERASSGRSGASEDERERPQRRSRRRKQNRV